ncbi:MAG: OmpA family protein [Patulibacter minatonensis]
MAKKGKHAAHDEHPDERWLLTYADLITLLMALFVVMFSISNVNKGKFDELAQSLNSAFNGPPVMSGGESIKQTGGESGVQLPAAAPPRPSLQEAIAQRNVTTSKTEASQEQEDLQRLQSMINSEAQRQGIGGKVQTELSKDGLTIRLKTDGLLFDPGSATVKTSALPLLRRMASLFRADGRHPILVSGHTDSTPIASGQFPSNWELSTARASAVVRLMVSSKVSPARLTATGRAYYDPIGSNGTAAGRAQNRRVELFIPRAMQVSDSATAAASDTTTSGLSDATASSGASASSDSSSSDAASSFDDSKATKVDTSEDDSKLSSSSDSSH